MARVTPALLFLVLLSATLTTIRAQERPRLLIQARLERRHRSIG